MITVCLELLKRQSESVLHVHVLDIIAVIHVHVCKNGSMQFAVLRTACFCSCLVHVVCVGSLYPMLDADSIVLKLVDKAMHKINVCSILVIMAVPLTHHVTHHMTRHIVHTQLVSLD